MNKPSELEGARTSTSTYRRVWLALALLAFAPGASAWNDTGHMVAALVAYDRMAQDVRNSLARTLHSHPRFQEDFEPRLPKSLRKGAAAEQDRWYFAFASTWPDVARRFDAVSSTPARQALIARYNHGTWHYINLPIYLQSTERRRLDVRTPSLTWSAGLDDAGLNVVQALQMLTANWCASGAADRALTIAWMTHLIADLHQPLHAAALFTYPAFIRGDRGGNDIRVTGGNGLRADNLHALWDGALGNASRFDRLEAQARDVGRSPAGKPQMDDRGDRSRNFASWAKQSRALAASTAYTAEVRNAVASASGTRPPSVAIGDGYLKAMHAAAVQQIAASGRRTASVLTALHNETRQTVCSQQGD